MGVTIKDVAKLAGVSHTTVSRVLNNSQSVKPDTREKILGIIKELNFSPHTSARSLISGKNYTIGLVILYDLQQFPPDFLPSILMGMATELNKGGYSLTLFFDHVQGKKQQVSLRMLNKNALDGVFVLSVESETEVAYRVAKIDLPMVLVNQQLAGLELDSVVADDEGGAYDAVSHLIGLGHCTVGYIDGSPGFCSSISRKAGYRRALEEAGIQEDAALQRVGFFDAVRGYQAARSLLAARPDVTAIFAANDLMALGAMNAAKDMGLRIPGDIALAGFDDANFANVMGLTTVNKPRTQMGAEAARLMLGILSDGPSREVRNIVLPTRLVVRGSTQS